jgi:Protein kinase domain
VTDRDATTADPLAEVLLTTTTVGALELAAARRHDRPLGTLDILFGLIGIDIVADWELVQLRTSFVTPADALRFPDPEPDALGQWRNVLLTTTAFEALSTAGRLAASYRMFPLPPGILALAIVWRADSGASRALLEESDISHADLLQLLQDEVLGTSLQGLDSVLESTPALPEQDTDLATPSGSDLLEALPPLTAAGPWIAAGPPETFDACGVPPQPARDEDIPSELAARLGIALGDLHVLRRGDHMAEAWVLVAGERVFKAYDLRTLTPEELRRCHAEASISLSLGELPGIVGVRDVTTDDGWLVIEMPRLGSSLRAHLTRAAQGQEPRRKAEAYADELAHVARTLETLHARGLVHRAVKPENLLADPATGHLALADFSIAAIARDPQSGSRRRPARWTVTGRAPHRNRYVAPEQYQGEVGPAIDQYALGVTAREVFDMRGAPPVTVPVHEVLERATAQRPGDRFPSATAFGDALRAAVRREAPRGLADRFRGLTPYRRFAIGPALFVALIGVGTVAVDAHRVQIIASLALIEGAVVAILFGGCAYVCIALAGWIRGRRERVSLKSARSRWFAPALACLGTIVSWLLRTHPTALSAIALPLGGAYTARAALAPVSAEGGGLVDHLLRVWDRRAFMTRPLALATTILAALIFGCALAAPFVVASLWPASPLAEPAGRFGPLVAVWEFRAAAGAGNARMACKQVLALPPNPRRSPCTKLVTLAGVIERADQVDPHHGVVFGGRGTLDSFRAEEIPAPRGVRVWDLHPPESAKSAGSMYTNNAAGTQLTVLVSREPPRVGNPRSMWLYDVAWTTRGWRVTGFRACTVARAGGGRPPAACPLSDTTPTARVATMLAAVARARRRP